MKDKGCRPNVMQRRPKNGPKPMRMNYGKRGK